MAARYKTQTWACLVLLSAALAFARPAASETDYAGHYERALVARDGGDFGGALAEIERALALRPDSVEALHLQGTLLGYLQRYDEAVVSLVLALEREPQNVDLQLSLARTLSWAGDLAAAEEQAATVLDAHPANLEAQLLQARLAYYQGRNGEAEQALDQILARRPGNLEALVLLGDVKLAEGDREAARAKYRKAAGLAPDDAEIADKLAGAQDRPWRADLGYTFSDFSREDRSDWHEGFVQLSRRVGRSSGVFQRVEASRRFERWDTHLSLGVDHRFGDRLAGYAAAGVTPDADFLARWTAAGGGSVRAWAGGDDLGATVVSVDYRHSDYDTGGVDTLSPGLQQYLLEGRVWLTGRWINTWNEEGSYTAGWLARLDWQAREPIRVHIGLANAPETVAGKTVDTLSVFAGLGLDLSRTSSVSLDYLRDDREDSYIRNAVTLAFTQRF